MRLFNGARAATNSVAGNVAIGAVGANTTAVDTVACPGARVGDFVVVRPAAALEAGIGFCGAYVAAANVVTVTLMNTTAGALPAAAFDYHVMCLPAE